MAESCFPGSGSEMLVPECSATYCLDVALLTKDEGRRDKSWAASSWASKDGDCGWSLSITLRVLSTSAFALLRESTMSSDDNNNNDDEGGETDGQGSK